MSLRHAVALVAFVSAIASQAALDVDSQGVVALQKALGSSATWTMERKFPESVRTLVSTGTVDCVVGTGIQWRVLHPFPSSVEMTVDSMVFEDEDGRRVKKLADMPYYSAIREKADDFARGDVLVCPGLRRLGADDEAKAVGAASAFHVCRAVRRPGFYKRRASCRRRRGFGHPLCGAVAWQIGESSPVWWCR